MNKKQLSLLVIAFVWAIPSLANAQFTHALASGASTLTCSSTSGTSYSTDVFVGTLTSNSTPTLPAAGICNVRDHVEIFATQGVNQAFTLVMGAGSGTVLAVLSNSGNTIAMPASTGGAANVTLHQIWIYDTKSSTPQWELVTQETYPAQSLTTTLNCANFSGGDIGAKINNCIAALPTPAGGIADARSFTGTNIQTTAINVGANGKPVQLLLGHTILQNNTLPCAIKYFLGSDIEGSGYSPDGNATDIDVGGARSAICQGDTSQGIAGVTIHNLRISMDSTTGSVGLDMFEPQLASVKDVQVFHADIALKFSTPNGGCSCYNYFDNVILQGISYGIYLNPGSASNSFIGGLAKATGSPGTAVYINADNNYFFGMDVESATTAYEIDGANAVGDNNQIFGAYLEGNGTNLKLDSGANQNIIETKMGGSVTDNSGGENYYFSPGDTTTPVIDSDRFRFQNTIHAGDANAWAWILMPPSNNDASVELQAGGAANSQIGTFGHFPLEIGSELNHGTTVSSYLYVRPIGTPTAPVATCVGSGSIGGHYYVVGNTYSPLGLGIPIGQTLPSLTSNTVASCASVTITPPQMDGIRSWDVFKNDTGHRLIQAGHSGTAFPLTDTGQATTVIAAPVRDSTGDVVIQKGIQTLAEYTIGGDLPTCNATAIGDAIVVNHNTACAYGATPTAGGSTKCKVFCDGTAWTIH